MGRQPSDAVTGVALDRDRSSSSLAARVEVPRVFYLLRALFPAAQDSRGPRVTLEVWTDE